MSDIILQVGVKIFLRNAEGKFLLLKRNPVKYSSVRGEWDIAGGRINPGTALLDNLQREVLEETGLHIVSDPKLICAQDIFVGDKKHVVRLSYLGDADGELVLDTNENTEYKWLSLDELENQENLDIYVKEIVDKGLISP